MRVTTEKKEQTRQRILEIARNLFVDNGYEVTTTRDIATAVGIATGTLFNYFPSKEALAMTMVAQALDQAREDFMNDPYDQRSLAECLFAFTLAGLRRLDPYRGFVGEVAETALSPFTHGSGSDEGERIRIALIETVHDLIAKRGTAPPTSLTMHLYWSLYLAILAYWITDDSPQQEQTLAVVDQATQLFVASMLPHSANATPDATPLSPTPSNNPSITTPSLNVTDIDVNQSTPESPEQLEV